jgi:hypothetical protein
VYSWTNVSYAKKENIGGYPTLSSDRLFFDVQYLLEATTENIVTQLNYADIQKDDGDAIYPQGSRWDLRRTSPGKGMAHVICSFFSMVKRQKLFFKQKIQRAFITNPAKILFQINLLIWQETEVAQIDGELTPLDNRAFSCEATVDFTRFSRRGFSAFKLILFVGQLV